MYAIRSYYAGDSAELELDPVSPRVGVVPEDERTRVQVVHEQVDVPVAVEVVHLQVVGPEHRVLEVRGGHVGEVALAVVDEDDVGQPVADRVRRQQVQA